MRLARFLLLPFLLASGLFVPAPAQAAASHVTIAQYAYGPGTLTVRVGDTVSWTNHDQASHDVATTSAPASFRSPLLGPGQSWSFRFTQPGTYSYYCTVHPDMKAQVVVLPADPPKPAPPAPAPAPAPAKPNAPASQPAPAPAPVVQSSSTVPPPTTTSAPSSAAAGTVQRTADDAAPQRLDPMLLVAGVVVGVATLCLLLIGSRREQ